MLRLATVILAMTWPQSPAKRVERPTVPVPAACIERFQRARDELISRGFAPTSDKDTRRWLRVVDQLPGVVILQLEMRTSADGPATFYQLRVYHPRTKGGAATRWRRRTSPYCCDEHAAKEDRLIEHSWTREANGFAADISVVEFEATRRDREVVRWRDMFASVGRKTGDDCLAAPR